MGRDDEKEIKVELVGDSVRYSPSLAERIAELRLDPGLHQQAEYFNPDGFNIFHITQEGMAKTQAALRQALANSPHTNRILNYDDEYPLPDPQRPTRYWTVHRRDWYARRRRERGWRKKREAERWARRWAFLHCKHEPLRYQGRVEVFTSQPLQTVCAKCKQRYACDYHGVPLPEGMTQEEMLALYKTQRP